MRSLARLLFPLLLLLRLLFNVAASFTFSQKIVTTLPGYPGTLPFKLETGYISMGENDEMQLFYYFIESQGNPVADPLFMWHSGGPSCSGFSGLIYEIGPVEFDLENFHGSLPSLLLREFAWTKLASIIFIDSPTGTGFSYYNATDPHPTTDTGVAKLNYEFLRKWLMVHPSFTSNSLYIAGDSFGGKIAVLVANEVAKGIIQGDQPLMALKGYIIGNSRDDGTECNDRIPYAHGMALISDEYYETAKRACNGNYMNPKRTDTECIQALHNIKKCISRLYIQHILEPKCGFADPRFISKVGMTPTCKPYLELEDDPPINFILMPKTKKNWCRNQNYVSSYVWTDDPMVREALGIRNGTVGHWKRCHGDITSAHIENVLGLNTIHRFLSDHGYQSLVYSGDHDIGIPYISTLRWIRHLNLSLSDDWRPWTVNGQIAGYTMSFDNNDVGLTFVTIKGAGHTAPEYKPEECYNMLDRWLSMFPL